MGRAERSILRAAGAVLLTVAASLIAAAAASAFSPDKERELQRIVEEYREDLAYPGLAAGVWQEGRGSFATTIGQGDLRTGRPLTLSDHFRIGSVTKTMTATLVLQLVQRGKLKLNDPVSEYVKGVPLGRLITIRMLLNHTSGIHDGPGQPILAKWQRNPHLNFSPKQLIGGAVRATRFGLPGERWGYSNTNYFLLAQIVKKLTPGPLGTLFERLFDRVGMKETSFRARRPVPEPAAHGYVGGKRGPRDTADWNYSPAWAAGGVTSTLDDLRRWAPAVATGRGLLNQRTQAQRLSFVPAEPGIDYGLGIYEWELPSGNFFGHNGVLPGYEAQLFYAPESKLTIVALANTSTEEDPVRPRPRFDCLGLDGLVPLLAVAVAEPGIAVPKDPCPT